MSDGRKFYCFCDANCRFETMSKEQILAAIAQAAEYGLVFDADAAFISQVKESNAGGNLTFWLGTQAQYNVLVTQGKKDPNCFYILTDCDAPAELTQKVKELQNKLANLTAASIGASPAGYGLGSDYRIIGAAEELDNLRGSGFFVAAVGVIDDYAGYWGYHIEQNDGGFATQRAMTYDGTAKVRTKWDGDWQPWECENPIMTVGVIYRTTERYMGLPVYKQLSSDGVIWWSTDNQNWHTEAERAGGGTGGTGGGEDGGYYVPAVSQLDETTMELTFTASKDSMPAVAGAVLSLPSGKNGKDGENGKTPVKGEDYYTEADKQEIVNAVLANFINVSEVGM